MGEYAIHTHTHTQKGRQSAIVTAIKTPYEVCTQIKGEGPGGRADDDTTTHEKDMIQWASSEIRYLFNSYVQRLLGGSLGGLSKESMGKHSGGRAFNGLTWLG